MIKPVKFVKTAISSKVKPSKPNVATNIKQSAYVKIARNNPSSRHTHSTQKREIKLLTDKSIYLPDRNHSVSSIKIGTLVTCIGVVIYDPLSKATFAMHLSYGGSLQPLKRSLEHMIKKQRIPKKRLRIRLFYSEYMKRYHPKKTDYTEKKIKIVREYFKSINMTPLLQKLSPPDYWNVYFSPKASTWKASQLTSKIIKQR